MLLSSEPELLPDAEEPDLPVVEPDFLDVLLVELPEAFPSVDELVFDFAVVDLAPEDDVLALLPFDEVEEVGVVPELPMLEVLPISDEPELLMPELLSEDEPDVLPDILPEL